MKSKNGEEDLPLVRIRVKERVGKVGQRRRLTPGEKLLLVILGACLGLGIGYLAAGKVLNYLRPASPAEDVGWHVPPPARRHAPSEERSSPLADIDFDLPSKGK